MKANKQQYIDFIVECFDKGVAERVDVMASIGKKWQLSERTFDRYFKIAKGAIQERNKHLESARLSVMTENIKDAVNEAIISDLELEAILCQIAQGNMKIAEIVGGEAVLTDIKPNDMVNAIDKLFKKRGTYAPTKQDVNLTDKGGADKLFIEK